MTDYGALLRDQVTSARPHLPAGVRAQASGRRGRVQVPAMATGFPIPSSAAFGRIGDQYVKAIYQYAELNGIPVAHFKKGENKEETARPYLEAAAREGKDRV